MPKPTYEEMAKENSRLKKQLSESEACFTALFNHSGFAVVLVNPDTGIAVKFNDFEHERLGYTREEFENRSLDDNVVEREPGESERRRQLVNENGFSLSESTHKSKDGRLIHMLISSVAIEIEGVPYHQNIAMDITKLKDTEAALAKANQELEFRVEKRTEELKEKTIALEEMVTALRVLLQHKDDSIAEIEEKLLTNTQALVQPYLDKLKTTKPTQMQLQYIELLELNFKEIVSPFIKNLTSLVSDLSPSEVNVATHIKEGLSTKEIAILLNLGEKTIETYRNRIRKKLGLKTKKINLRTYLKSLQDL
jgi:PAS domain S-box-containing protein